MPGQQEPPIEFRSVWKVFGQRAQAAMQAIRTDALGKAAAIERFNCVVGLADVNLSLRAGEIFCVMGLSGSGKSTLVRLVNGLIRPTSGQVLIHGRDIESFPPDELRELRSRRIGMVFQNVALLPHRTVRENVALPLELRGATKEERWNVAKDALSLVQLAGWEEAYPHELSGGMRQRVGLARALAANPDILLMDEPFSALDPLIRRQLQDEFLKLSAVMNKTTVFITHDLDEAIRLGHRIAIMRDGAIVQVGTPEEILERPADDYVAAFVSGISRLDLMRASALLDPDQAAIRAAVSSSAPQASSDTALNALIEIFMHRDGPVTIVDAEGEPLGVVTKQAAFAAVQKGHRNGRIDEGDLADVPLPARAAEGFEDAVAVFAVAGIEHYKRAFRRFATGHGPAIGFNWAAAAFGPLWAAGRGLWGFFTATLAAELIAFVQIGRGLWSDLGQAALARAENLQRRSDQLAAQAAEATKAGAENAAALTQMSKNLAAGAKTSMADYEAAAAQAMEVLLIGVALLLVTKLAEGILADGALERRFNRWRVDRSLASGMSTERTLIGAAIAIPALAASIFAFTVPKASDLLPWMFTFPAQRQWSTSIGRAIDDAIAWISINGTAFFSGISFVIRLMLDAMELVLVGTPWPLVAAAILLISWRLAGLRFALFTGVALAYLGLFGFWQTSMETIALLGTAALLATVLGVPLGVWFGKSERAYSFARPVLDFAQTMPAFVYLIPVIAFFGIGKPPAIIATLIFGMPPVIRLTALGLQQVPHDLKEAAIAFGASPGQLLRKVELPLSRPSIMAGINQTTLMCLAMVVIASLIGAKGLGQQVLEALQYANKGAGLLAGLAILFCAMILDRLVQSRQNSDRF